MRKNNRRKQVTLIEKLRKAVRHFTVPFEIHVRLLSADDIAAFSAVRFAWAATRKPG